MMALASDPPFRAPAPEAAVVGNDKPSLSGQCDPLVFHVDWNVRGRSLIPQHLGKFVAPRAGCCISFTLEGKGANRA